MDMFRLVGKRLAVRSKDGKIDFGLGTYLWADEILLDSGKKILDADCVWEVKLTAPPAPPFEITLLKDVRVFKKTDRSFIQTSLFLEAGRVVGIEKVEIRPWNHGDYVAGKFTADTTPYWLLMSEVELPFEKPPFLRAVK